MNEAELKKEILRLRQKMAIQVNKANDIIIDAMLDINKLNDCFENIIKELEKDV